MHDRAFRALLALEIRRATDHIRRGMLSVLVVGVLLLMLFGVDGRGFAMAFGVLGATFGFLPTMRMFPDKLDGTFEFLTSLPVPPAVLAGTRLAACAAAALLAAAAFTLAAALSLPGYTDVALGVRGYVGVFLGIWLTASAFSGLGAGVVLRLPLETLTWFPAAVFAVVIAAAMGLDRYFPDMDTAFVEWLLLPGSPRVLLGVLVLAQLTALWTAFVLLRSGFHRFRPAPGGLPGAVDSL